MELGHLTPLTSWISIFGNELRLSLPCLDWMSTWLVLLACLLWNQPSLLGFFTTSLSPCCCVLRSTNLIDKNGTFKRPFSASNFDNSCCLLRHPLCLFNLQVLSLFHKAFYHHLTLRGCALHLANLIAKNGSWSLPFLALNCDIRCYIWLYFCLASGLSPLDRGFYHFSSHLSVDCGGSIPPSEFWSWISSTFTLDGFHCPLRMMNWVFLRNFYLLACHGVDLLTELLYPFTRKFSAILCVACSWFVSLLASFRLILV